MGVVERQRAKVDARTFPERRRALPGFATAVAPVVLAEWVVLPGSSVAAAVRLRYARAKADRSSAWLDRSIGGRRRVELVLETADVIANLVDGGREPWHVVDQGVVLYRHVAYLRRQLVLRDPEPRSLLIDARHQLGQPVLRDQRLSRVDRQRPA